MEQLISRGRRITIQRHSDSIHKLIEAVEESECLWNGCSENYKNRKAKEASWSSIALNLEVSKKDALDKWNSLRKTYRGPSFLCSAVLEDACDTMLSFLSTPKQRKSDEAARKQALMKSVTDAVSGIKERKRDLSSQFGDYIASNHRNLERDHPDLALELQIGVNKVLSDV
ncbi:hypothetical protein ACLKA6_007771 [Drosophila palustris]